MSRVWSHPHPNCKDDGGHRSLPHLTLVVVTLLLACILAGCGRSSDKSAKPAGTNAVASKTVTRTNAPTPGQPAVVRVVAPTNPMTARPFVRTNVMGAAKAGARTNAPGALAHAGTNGVAGKTGSSTQTGGGISDKLRSFSNSSYFYPVVVVIAIGLSFGGLFLYQVLTGKSQKREKGASSELGATSISRPIVKKKRGAPITSCNVLHIAPETRHLWQFAAKGRGFALNRDQTVRSGEQLPSRLINKDWTSLWQRKLNIAWLPPEQVFLRVVQLPNSDFDETVSMVELQLEKLSPMPVTQIVWSIQILHHSEGNLQTVIVMIVSRNVVEEFLGTLESQGYLADRLELPRLDQLLATSATSDGAWIYPETSGLRNTALIAWWYGGVLQSLALINLPAKANPESLKEQLVQLSWAGELEGWLTAPPSWHLVADATTAAEWEPPLRAALEQPIEVVPALALPELAAKTAVRAVHTEPQANLLPVEFADRYRQQFVDRLWMRGLGAVIGLYLVGVLIYFGRLQIENFRVSSVDEQIARVGPIYTNSVQLKAKCQILKDRQDLKWAALDCWKNIAELLPDGFTLEGFNFTDGKRLALNGTAPLGQEKRLIDFDTDLRRVRDGNQQLMFDPNAGDHVTFRRMAGDTLSWSCVLELKKSEEL